MKIVSFKICPFVQRVTAVLEARNIPYEIEYISLSDKPDWFLERSPHGQVPVLITDEDVTLFESEAIMEYINDVYPAPGDELTPEARAVERAWGYLAAKNYLVQCSTMRSPDEAALADRENKLRAAFVKMDNALGEGRFFAGDVLGNVEIAWLPLLHRTNIIERHTGYDFLRGLPKLKAWQAEIMATGIPEKSVSEDFESRFTGFYLSDETWLGAGLRLTG